jgi:hypothetical protein
VKIVVACASLLFAACAAALLADEAPTISRWRTGGVDYALYSRGAITGNEAREILARFDAVLRESRRELFATHDLPEPALIQVALAGDARIFADLTGRPWYIAGLVIVDRARPDYGRLYFQNPTALRKRGILESTVRHELCHLLLDGARTSRPAPLAAPDESWSWLEEGYCEALGAAARGGSACVRDSAAIHAHVRRLARVDQFADWIMGRLKGSAQGVRGRRQAFCAASAFAREWLGQVGRAEAVRVLARERTRADQRALADSYDAFRKKFR